jgi:hypothetical protein
MGEASVRDKAVVVVPGILTLGDLIVPSANVSFTGTRKTGIVVVADPSEGSVPTKV